MRQAFKSRKIVGKVPKEPRGYDESGKKTKRWMIQPLMDERASFKLLYNFVSFEQADDAMTDVGTMPIDHYGENVDHDHVLTEPNPEMFIHGIDDDEIFRPPPGSRRKPN